MVSAGMGETPDGVSRARGAPRPIPSATGCPGPRPPGARDRSGRRFGGGCRRRGPAHRASREVPPRQRGRRAPDRPPAAAPRRRRLRRGAAPPPDGERPRVDLDAGEIIVSPAGSSRRRSRGRRPPATPLAGDPAPARGARPPPRRAPPGPYGRGPVRGRARSPTSASPAAALAPGRTMLASSGQGRAQGRRGGRRGGGRGAGRGARGLRGGGRGRQGAERPRPREGGAPSGRAG